jgi:Phage integrase, N-terminal SAM-like domain
MATIERRVRNGKTTYRVRYRDPAGSQRSRVFARKADAQRFLNETETAKARGTWTDPALGRVLFRDWLGEWWATTTNLRPKTRDRDELLLRRLALPSFGAVPLAAISQRDVRAWVAELSARGLAPATVQKAYQLLGKVMGAAVDAGMLAQSPCRRVPLPKVEREEMRFLTPAEVATLADVIDRRYRALVLVGAYGGLRIGELAGLRRSRVDLLRGTVQVAEIMVEVQGRAAHRATQDPGQPPHGGIAALRGRGAGHPPGRAGRSGGLRVHGPEGWPAAGDRVPGSGVAAGDQGGWLGGAAHPRPSAYGGGVVDRGRCQSQGGRRSGWALLGELHPGPLRPPVPGGRYRPPRPPGCALRHRPVDPRGDRGSAAWAGRPWPQCGPRRSRGRRERRPGEADGALTCSYKGWR